MTNALQIKLLAGILAVLTLIAGILVHHTRPVSHDEMIKPDAAMEKKYENFVKPRKPYLIP